MSKLGLHTINSGPPSGFPYAAVVKYVTNPPPAVPAAAVTLWRFVREGDICDQWWPQVNPVVAARRWITEQWEHIQHVPLYVYIEPQNEPNLTEQNAAWFWDFSLAFMVEMDAIGRKVCIGNFAKGNPTRPRLNDGGTNGLAIWTPALPALRYAKAHGHKLGFHAYGPIEKDASGNFFWNDYIMLRHREVYAWLPEDARTQFVINEFALDTPLGQYLDPRWRDTVTDPEATYMAWMADYDRVLQADPYCEGVTVYTRGTGGDRAWLDFDLNQRMLELLAEHIRSTGENDMAKFSTGQIVFLNAWANVIGGDSIVLRDGNGDKIGLAAGTQATILDGPRKLLGRTAIYWKVQAGGVVGNIEENSMSVSASAYTTQGKMGPDYERALPLMRDPETDSMIVLVEGARITDRWLAYDGRTFARGMNWYHTTGRGIDGASNFEAGWLPSRWLPSGQNQTELQVYPSDGKLVPNWNERVVDLPPDDEEEEEEPVTIWPDPPEIPVGIDLLEGKTFEDGHATDDKGNQEPLHWSLWYTRANGEPMPFPTKHADSADGTQTIAVPATAMGWGEYVLRSGSTLPIDERLGAVRSLILDGDEVFKGMGNIAQAFMLVRKFQGTPGKVVTLVVHISAESQDVPQSRVHPGKLEDDHLQVRVKFGSVLIERNYADMQLRRDVRLPNGEVVNRPWNILLLTTTFPEHGELEVSITCQNNWPRTFPTGGNDFFIDKIMVIASEGDTPPPDDLPDISAELDSIDLSLLSASRQVEAIRTKLRG